MKTPEDQRNLEILYDALAHSDSPASLTAMLKQIIGNFEAELAALRADGVRLEWMLKYKFDWCEFKWDIRQSAQTPRAAIDAAIEAEKEPVDKMLADAQRDVKEFNQRIMVDPNSLHEPTGKEKIQNSEEAERDK